MKRAALLTPTAAVVASALWHLPHVRHFSAASHLGLKHHRHYSSRSQVHTPFSAQTDTEMACEITIDPQEGEREEEVLLGCLCFFMICYILAVTSFP